MNKRLGKSKGYPIRTRNMLKDFVLFEKPISDIMCGI